MPKAYLTENILNRHAKIGVIGLGYVGLPLALLFVEANFEVFGFDTNQSYIKSLKEGRSSIVDVSSGSLTRALETGRFRLTTDVPEMQQADIYLICVPTPLSKTRQPDLSYVEQAVRTIVELDTKDKLIVLESTTYPGTTDELLLTKLAQSGSKLDQDFLLAFSPERVDPGNTAYPLAKIPKVVGGVSRASTEVAASLYGTVFNVVHVVSSAKVAETTKLLENTFRNVNIALANEFAQICDRLSVDVWEVIEAAKTKPFGFMPFYPGPGIGGHCIPLDPQYLIYKARLSGFEPRLVALADQINQEMPRFIAHKAMEMLNEQGKSLKNSKVLVLGVAYKPDIPDVRESPALEVIRELRQYKANVSYADPFVPELTLLDGTVLQNTGLDLTSVQAASLIIVTTAHSSFDYDMLENVSEKVLDTRDSLAKYKQSS